MRPRRHHLEVSRPVVKAFVAGLATVLAMLLLEGAAWADALTPEAGPTQNAIDTDTLYKIVLILGAAVVALVWGILFYSLVRFRARRGRTAPQIRGNTRLELSWTLGATALVVVIAIVSLIYLDNIREPAPSGAEALAQARGLNAAINQPPPPGGDALEVTVSGQQYIWRFQYPNGAVSFTEMVVPKDVTVLLKIRANDVVHSWWIPELGGKQDAVPGLTNESWFKATATGTFEGQCAELCGANHAAMKARVTVVEPGEYRTWVDRQKRLIAQAQRLAQAQKRQLQGDGAQAR